MQRFWISLIVIVSMTAIYHAYVAALSPYMAAASAEIAAPVSEEIELHSPLISEKAREFFPDMDWTHQARHVWQRQDEAFLFAQEIKPVPGNGNALKMEPLAVVWYDPRRPGERPYRIWAAAALVQFQLPFSAGGEDSPLEMSRNPGRIINAALEGKVHIDGPDGLVIDGTDFVFSEDSAQLYSDHQISFRHGPTPQDSMQIQGHATGLIIEFTKTVEPTLGRDLPRVGEIAQFELRRDVVLDARLEMDKKPQDVRVTSAGRMEYHAIKRQLTLDTQVNVKRQDRVLTGETQHADSLSCEWLGLEFEQDPTKLKGQDPEDAGLFDGLVFKRMRAHWTSDNPGSRKTRVRVESGEQGLIAVAQDLTYDALKRTAVLTDDRHVDVAVEKARIQSPQIKIQHDQNNEIESLECLQGGKLVLTDEKLGNQPAELIWQDTVSLIAETDGDSQYHVATVNGNIQFSLPDQAALLADKLRLWLTMTSDKNESDSPPTGGLQGIGGSGQKFMLHRALAAGRVRMASPDLEIRRAEHVDVVMRPGQVDQPTSLQQRSPQEADESSSENQDSKPANPWIAEADSFRILVIQDASNGNQDLRNVEAIGNVRIENHPANGISVGKASLSGPTVIEAAQLFAENHGGIQQTVTFKGDQDKEGGKRASFSIGEARIEGNEIVVDRQQNLIEILGRGGFRFPLKRSLDGRELQAPIPLTTFWEEKMVFDGHAAKFFGAVTCNLTDVGTNMSKLQCEELTAVLSHPVSFADMESRPAEIDIEIFQARHNVRLDSREWNGNEVVGIRNVELAAFKLTQSTGDFVGEGRGIINDWSIGDSIRMTPAGTAQANQPANLRNSAPSWRYTSIDFSGQIIGNMMSKEITLNDRVHVLSAPVSQSFEKFRRDQLMDDTSEARNAIALTCDKLHVLQRTYQGEEKAFAEVTASGGPGIPELESQMFEALADELFFDERHGQFVLRGIGRDANLWIRRKDAVNQTWRSHPHSSRAIRFVPSESKISIDSSSGFTGGT